MTTTDPANPLHQLIAGVEAATTELAQVKKALRRQRRIVRFDVTLSVLGMIIAALLFFVLNGQSAQRHREKVTAHIAAVAQCKTTDDIRSKIRLGNDTTANVIASFFPTDAPPTFRVLLDQAQVKWAAVDAGIPNLDCTKVP